MSDTENNTSTTPTPTMPAKAEAATNEPQPQQQKSAAATTAAPKKKTKHADDFIFGDTLGHGSFGDVVKGIDKETGKEYAIKIMEKELAKRQGKAKYVITERDIMSKCNHPNIVKLSYTFRSNTSLRKYYSLRNTLVKK